MKHISNARNCDLFDGSGQDSLGHLQQIDLPDADLVFYPSYFTKQESDAFFEELQSHTKWTQEQIRIYGKTIQVPRLTAWYGDDDTSYSYSGITMTAEPWTPTLREIKEKTEKTTDKVFNSVLMNLYRDGQDSVSWHSDDEAELGRNPVIGSVSFGGDRNFQFKHRYSTGLRHEIRLSHGSFLLMKGPTQHYWSHQIPKTKKPCCPRINLTFRVIEASHQTGKGRVMDALSR